MNMHSAKLKEFRQALAGAGLDGYAVTEKLDLGYLTGYHMEGYMILAGRKNAFAFLPVMLLDQFRQRVDFCGTVKADDQVAALLDAVKKNRMKKIGFDPDMESYSRGRIWAKNGFIAKPGLVVSLREIKKADEISALRKACGIAAAAVDAAVKTVRPGIAESALKKYIEDKMRDMGAEGPSFDTIIAFGSNAALPHHCTSQRRLRKNEAVLIDTGCVYRHYRSDITRTFFFGRPGPEFQKVYSIVERSHSAGIRKVGNGVPAKDVDSACREVIIKEGYGDKFIHGTGHGIGLEIHESPRLNSRSKTVLKTGMTVTVEPGIYLNGKFGVRIEDSVLVTDKGCEIMTRD